MELTATSQVFTTHQWEELKHELSLTDRQSEIVERLLSGQGDKQIAHELQMSAGTLRTHLDRLFRRFAAKDRSELVAYVFTRFLKQCQSCGCPRFR